MSNESIILTGLCNPGAKYALTRHNIGQIVLSFLTEKHKVSFSSKYKSFYGKITLKGNDVHVLFPQTYMNLSGEAVLACAQFFKVNTKNILALHDEIDFEFGKLAFKQGGGLAGHNGLKSMAKCLGTQDFNRLRLGVGRPLHPAFSVADYVLSNFTSDEQIAIEQKKDLFISMLETYCELGISKTMNKFNKENFK